MGRGSGCDIRLPDPTISRRHAAISRQGEEWMLTDLGGANGTWLNDVRLDKDVPAPLAEGDRIRVGPWVLSVGAWATTTMSLATDDDAGESLKVQAIAPGAGERMAIHRLRLLVDCAGRINRATDDAQLAEALVEAAVEGTGYTRAALLRPGMDGLDVEVLGWSAPDGSAQGIQFSRSLVKAACEGQMVSLSSDAATDYGQSIADLNIHSAMCCPVEVDEAVAACLYLDARGGEESVAADATSFCEALSRVAGLALANLRRREMQKRQDRMTEELGAAREAQQFMIPEESGRTGHLGHAVVFEPGRTASGDLFDVMALDENRVALFLGDVSGKGVGAAILMAAAQAYLRGALKRHDTLQAAVEDLNGYVVDRTPAHRFLTLWVGVFGSEGTVEFVDAGHGYWAHITAEGVTVDEQAECPPIGFDAMIEYPSESVRLESGERIVLMTDGVPEQPDLAGNQFGTMRITDTLKSCESPEDDVKNLLSAVRSHAGGQSPADDTTIASVGPLA
ncbi:MAG: SpoIIE family protein phosphatase [Phycisphaerales bacterium]|nr:SpoIIE family protein phosphatase [Phycisphaerales bacterium]